MALHSLIQLAPTGFPAFSKVNEALLLLQADIGICRKLTVDTFYTAADKWKTMCFDVHRLACKVNESKIEPVERATGHPHTHTQNKT